MGDRRQVIFMEEGKSIYLYVHWDGYRLPFLVQEAIATAQTRWSDRAYCTRILIHYILEEVVTKDSPMTGAGISTEDMETQYPGEDIRINVAENTVGIEAFNWSFEEYLKRDWRKD